MFPRKRLCSPGACAQRLSISHNVWRKRTTVSIHPNCSISSLALDRPEQIRDLTEAARKVPGVRDVASSLHLRDMPVTNKASAMTADM